MVIYPGTYTTHAVSTLVTLATIVITRALHKSSHLKPENLPLQCLMSPNGDSVLDEFDLIT